MSFNSFNQNSNIYITALEVKCARYFHSSPIPFPYIFELPITRIPDSQESAVVKMIKTWIHRFAVKNIPKMKSHRSIVPSAATYLHVTPSYGTSTFQHFFFSGECVAFYLPNRKRRTFMPLRQTNRILIFLFSGCFMFDVRRESFRGELETILMNLNLNH